VPTCSEYDLATNRLFADLVNTNGTTITNLVGSTITMSANATAGGTVTPRQNQDGRRRATGRLLDADAGRGHHGDNRARARHRPQLLPRPAGRHELARRPSMYLTADATNVTLNFSAALTAATPYTWLWDAEALPT
jgi:hypothetical protein